MTLSPSEPPRGFSASPPAGAPQVTRCPACGGGIDPYDRFCRHCGRRLADTAMRWYYHPLWIIILTVTVAGPFTLPLVWRSPKLDRRARWLMTAGIVLFTLFFLFYTWRVVNLVLGHISEISGELDKM